MNLLQALIFGIVEGITEFLPVSSTGHLILTAKVLGLEQSEFIKSFQIVIQLGAILAVVLLYWKKLILDRKVMARILTAFFPTAVLGLIFYKVIKQFFMESQLIVLGALFFGGIFLIIFELVYRQRADALSEIEDISYSKCFAIGLFQSVAFIPGVSRAAATIIGGLVLGLKRKTIVEFSFLLAVPTMLAATVLDLVNCAGTFSLNQFIFLAVGFISSFIMAMLGIKFLLFLIKNHSFIPFGIYRIILSALFLLLTHF
jgi:undecaprenyl-diphosphatase